MEKKKSACKIKKEVKVERMEEKSVINNLNLNEKKNRKVDDERAIVKDDEITAKDIEKEDSTLVFSEDCEEENLAKKVLIESASLAAKTLVLMMSDENSSNSLKVDCAKEILTRLYGRTFAEGESEKTEITLPKEFDKFCV